MKNNRPIFSKRVLKIVSYIPRGSTLTYKEVARMAGSYRAYRAVGNILRKNFNPLIPCHRVVCSNGKLGLSACGHAQADGYNQGRDTKRAILVKEGVVIKKQ